jgi:predicted nuclease with TOPRIM domain
VSSSLKELKTSNKELREEHGKLEKKHNELNTRYNLLKDEYTTLKINHDSLVVVSSHEPCDATNNVVKIDIATSCDDLIVESIEQDSSAKARKWLSPTIMMIIPSSRVKMRSLRKILRRPQSTTPL